MSAIDLFSPEQTVQFVKRVILGAIRATGYSVLRNSELDRHNRELNEWATAKVAEITAKEREVNQWAMAKEAQVATKEREVNEWVSAKEEEIMTKIRVTSRWAEEGNRRSSNSLWTYPSLLVLLRRCMILCRMSAPAPIFPKHKRISSNWMAYWMQSRWCGDVPIGYMVDFLGRLTDVALRPEMTGSHGGFRIAATRPSIQNSDEGWFELIDWIVSAREARDQYVAISLGASYGAQVVGAWKALQVVNPLPCRLVAVDPVSENCASIAKHMADNGIDPSDHCIIQAAVARNNEPVLFPVGASGSGRNNCVMTNEGKSRAFYADFIRQRGDPEIALKNLLTDNSTGIIRDLGRGWEGEIKFVSAVTLADILGPFERIDLLEVDIQQSEGDVIPPFLNVLNRKVRRVHIGTHGGDIHTRLRKIFLSAGWHLIFDYGPDAEHITELGSFRNCDGILTAYNPLV